MVNTIDAFIMGEANRHKELMVFDWNKAAKIIRERKPKEAWAGLHGDWEWTSGIIYENGTPIKDDYTFLASTWAKPELAVDEETLDCYVMEHETTWNAETTWPESALAILNEKNGNPEEAPSLMPCVLPRSST